MSTYIKSIEEQNDLLKEQLSFTELELETLRSNYNAAVKFRPRWVPFEEDSGCPNSMRLVCGKGRWQIVIAVIHPAASHGLYNVEILTRGNGSSFTFAVIGDHKDAQFRAEERIYGE
jgi:hypothetical protein